MNLDENLQTFKHSLYRVAVVCSCLLYTSPEEVRAAIEEHKDEIHSEEDVRRMAENLMLRR